MINILTKKVHNNAKEKGFYNNERNIGELLCLIHSEVSEALEADRKDHFTQKSVEEIINTPDEDYKEVFEANVKNTFEDELADIVIRVMDLAGYKNIDLETHILAKLKYNSSREQKHGKKY